MKPRRPTLNLPDFNPMFMPRLYLWGHLIVYRDVFGRRRWVIR